jgi:tRNA uridine 5-carboxymethylaminomethyl modification enzyme
MLNLSRGPAVHSPRAQCDKLVYQRRMQQVLEREPNLVVHQAEAVALLTDPAHERITGVQTQFGDLWECRTVVVATGTFLGAKLHYGMQDFPGGRAGDSAANALTQCLAGDLGLELGRLKTGTPPRVLASTLDLDALERQESDAPRGLFSFREPSPDTTLPRLGGDRDLERLPCYLTHSTEETARLIEQNLDQSPLYGGRIQGIGTRYCPSFEDKVVRFPEHRTHLIYLEPEGVFTDEYYLNGISTSLPPAVQRAMVRSLPGLEHAHITRYAYAIEYDFVFPHQLRNDLSVRHWPNLFLAGQINGTSGYEEAAGQGLVAGVNAARLAAGTEKPLVLKRDQAYVGVMIDDLVTKDIIEPYRLFTSRAEHRLLLRQDNADLRLAPLGYDLGLVPRTEFDRVKALEEEIRTVRERLEQTQQGGNTQWEILRRPGTDYLKDLVSPPRVSDRAREQLQILARYEGYIAREDRQARSLRELGAVLIPDTLDFDKVTGLGTEARTKLNRFRPASLAQAARIDGVTPADIALLQIHLRRIAGT